MRHWVYLLILLFLTGVPLAGAAKTRAVLVGVSDYLYLDADLKGPGNDVGLMVEALTRRGVDAENITVLADEGASVPLAMLRGQPDRDTILLSFENAIKASGAGDLVIFYFSGHGTQAPDQDGDEGGGYDELFLPKDTRGWNGSLGEVENAIRDDTFAMLSNMAADRRVRIVAILDACHSGTGFRAFSDSYGGAKYILPESMGIPNAPSPSTTTQGVGAPRGEFAYLYAAQSDQRAFEYPVGEEGDQKWFGDFTRALTSLMNEQPSMSWATLVAGAAQRMQTRNGKAAQTPDIEGPLADAPIPGSESLGLTRIEVSRTELNAGELHDITVGSQVALFASLLDETPVGMAVVENVKAIGSTLRYLDPVPTVRVSHAEIVDRAPDTSLTISLSQRAALALEEIVPGGQEQLTASLDFQLSPRGMSTQYLIDFVDSQFVWLGPDRVVDKAGIGTSPRLAGSSDNLIETLVRSLTANVARVRLDRALAQLEGGGKAIGFSLLATGPKVTFHVLPGQYTGGRCRKEKTDSEEVAERVKVTNCDILEVVLSNPTSRLQDVTLLYSDPVAGITLMWPRSNLSNRLESGATKTLRYSLTNDGSTAPVLLEDVIVLSVPAEPGSVRTVFSGLQTGEVTRGDNGFMAQYLAELTAPSVTLRSLSLKPKRAILMVTRLKLEIAAAPTDD